MTSPRDIASAPTYVRLQVEAFDVHNIIVRARRQGEETAWSEECYALRGENEEMKSALAWLRTQLRQGGHTQLSLIMPVVEGAYIQGKYLIYEPDYLLDISSVAACFDTGSPLQYILSKFSASVGNTLPILLGNFASQLLDESLHHPDAPLPYAESIRNFFAANALDFATCTDNLSGFHSQAQRQRDNIRKLLRETEANDRRFKSSEALLEPSFYAECLGLQGRMDLMGAAKDVLVEQKSGKRDLSDNARETHRVQLQLYLAALCYGFGMKSEAISSYLLYSKYEDGMLQESMDDALLARALQMRNEIVALEMQLGRETGTVRQLLSHLHADDLRRNPRLSNRFWENWKKPEIERVLQPLHANASLSLDYFYRFASFVEREQMLSRMGLDVNHPTGSLALWHTPTNEKLSEGNLLWPLHLAADDSDDAKGEHITFLTDGDEATASCNFRAGDGVLFYAVAAGEQPDIRRDIVFRGAIDSLEHGRIVVLLNAPQHNRAAFSKAKSYAMEHDITDTSRALYRGLLAFLNVEASRKELILGTRIPRRKAALRAQGDYDSFQALVDGACQAEELYLVVGPPGTGKTSFGMLNIVEEYLRHRKASILLTAYTNRAVDEICQKLADAGHDFLRIGREGVTAAPYRQYLLSQRAQQCSKLAELRSLLLNTPIIVATTSTLASQPQLFSLKGFDLCIVDEASQILEPQLLPLLCAQHGSEVAIRRFTLIGDHKQLPAVVQQTASESAVESEALKEIGLENCRQSFFERMLRRLRVTSPQSIYQLTHQGRMHTEVASFASRQFYEGKLLPVPLPHQEGTLPFLQSPQEGLAQLLSAHRFLFFHVGAEGEARKSNRREAELIARIALQTWRLYRINGLPFSPEKTLGIIVPYRNQIGTIRHHIQQLIGSALPNDLRQEARVLLDVNIDTVERYQGSQREVIIYGFTVSSRQQLDFLTAENFRDEGEVIDRKLNVALTRAREQLFIVGDTRILEADDIFSRLITYASKCDALVQASDYFTRNSQN